MTRYAFGGDEHVYGELAPEMSLDAFFKGLSITNLVREAKIKGVTEVCAANASFQVRFDPDVIKPDDMLALVKELEEEAEHGPQLIETRIVEVPVFYEDPWTYETLMRFRERHQDPSGTDLDYTRKINGYATNAELIAAHHGTPWIISMVGFVAGLPWLYQLVEREKQIQSPKYLRPRTDTPKLCVAHGGAFGSIYSVRGAGGYQMFGVTPLPIYDPSQTQPHLKENMVLFKPGDFVRYRPIDRATYDAMAAEVEACRFEARIGKVRFSLDEYKADRLGTIRKLEGALP
ncbi:Allophanate hydrolase subunit 1 [Arboricoccus pini]|uniref:Allophanate hydrolase subunit 1 n=1 Tax=Arboricoccus pini TaxID=1963835 RepID=A0A212RI05_9PROT|nr:carboxyltransferase domain-containing protein [Arboricoccus pini]SNB72030.1 Allophanate hydrolase subunit 1 [Arboricoccus pini]